MHTKNNSGKSERVRRTVRRILITFVLTAAAVYLATCAYMYFNQRAFIYFPQPATEYPDENSIEIRSGDITLRGWVLNEGSDEAVIYFGGNAERPESNICDFSRIFADQTVYLINYRGYGESEGSPTEEGLYADALAVFDHVSRKHSKITVIGRSLGTGVATYVASERELNGLVLIEPFDSIVHIASAAYPVFPVKLLIQDSYDSEGRAGSITTRTLIIMAGKDDVIPAWSTERLISSFDSGILEVAVIEEAVHNDIQNYPRYYRLLEGFVAYD